MSRLWYVVELVGDMGVRIEPGHPCEADALRALADKYVDLPDGADVEYVVEPSDPAGPWAYARPHQH